jgi:sterol desaturase/sphingolipid hydroxylase (fatty acid hydroxylase superfamily)
MNSWQSALSSIFHHAADMFASPNSLWFWGYVPVYFLIGGLTLFFGRRAVDRKRSPKSLLRELLPLSFYRSPSGRLDRQYFILKILTGTVVNEFAFYITAELLAARLAKYCGLMKVEAFSFQQKVVSTVLILLAMDFGYAIFHLLSHKVPILWRLHKIHHSATFLTPLTNERVHPFERLMEYSFVSVFIFFGAFAAIFIFGGLPPGARIQGIGLSILIFAVIPHLNHLRHSHVWLSFGPLNWFLSSPCMHQIHHSSCPEHHDKNFARIFSAIDLALGSIYVPKRKEALTFGVMEGGLLENSCHSIWQSLFDPFRLFEKSKPRALSKQPLASIGASQ